MIKLRIYSKQEYFDSHEIPANGARKPEHLYVMDSYYTSFWTRTCRLVMLMVDRTSGGDYRIHDDLTMPPNFGGWSMKLSSIG